MIGGVAVERKVRRGRAPAQATPFDRHAAIAWAEEALGRPPAHAHIVRVAGKGTRLERFVLPLDLCQPQNRTRGGAAWMIAKLKRGTLLELAVQAARRYREPVGGRPLVRCIRFSCVEPDRFNDGAKIAIDALCARTERAPNRLGVIRDDRPRDAQIEQWWEPAPRGRGFVLIEVWTND